jgi:ABC-type uncharacterized transport system substrate-binding protein
LEEKIMVKKPAHKKKATGKSKKKAILPNYIGLLHTGSSSKFSALVKVMFDKAQAYLRATKPSESIEIIGGGYYADDDPGLLEDLAAKLVNETNAELIVAAGGPQSAIAAKEATAEADDPKRRDLPVVFTTVAEPDKMGLVDTLNEPGGNLTGIAGKTSENDPMRLQLLHALVSQVPQNPPKTKVGVLINPGRQRNKEQFKRLKSAARKLKLTLVPRRAHNIAGIERAFKDFSDDTFLGVVVTADSFFNNNRAKVIAEADEYEIPTIYQWREFAVEHGLMSYGPSIADAYEQAGEFAARILLKEKPADMECWVPNETTFELIVNKTTAKNHLGLNEGDLPAKLLTKTVKKV